jgi:hypothetical protein
MEPDFEAAAVREAARQAHELGDVTSPQAMAALDFLVGGYRYGIPRADVETRQ